MPKQTEIKQEGQMKDRIEEVKKKLLNHYVETKDLRGCANRGAEHERIAITDKYARQICQLFPQPLDDEGLRGGVGRILLEYKEDALFLTEAISQILALLQPKIRQERERILRLFDYLPEGMSPDVDKFRQALKEGK